MSTATVVDPIAELELCNQYHMKGFMARLQNITNAIDAFDQAKEVTPENGLKIITGQNSQLVVGLTPKEHYASLMFDNVRVIQKFYAAIPVDPPEPHQRLVDNIRLTRDLGEQLSLLDIRKITRHEIDMTSYADQFANNYRPTFEHAVACAEVFCRDRPFQDLVNMYKRTPKPDPNRTEQIPQEIIDLHYRNENMDHLLGKVQAALRY